MCDDTQELRRLCSIDDAVVYLPLDPDEDASTTPAAPNEGGDGDDANADVDVDERQHYREMDKEDLISYTLRLQKEVSDKNNIIQSLTLQRDWILEKKAHVAELNEFMEILTESKKADERVSSSSIATTATPSSILKTWERACASSDHWKQWWQSGRPKPLRGVADASTTSAAPTTTTTTTPSGSTDTTITTNNNSSGSSNSNNNSPIDNNSSNNSSTSSSSSNNRSSSSSSGSSGNNNNSNNNNNNNNNNRRSNNNNNNNNNSGSRKKTQRQRRRSGQQRAGSHHNTPDQRPVLLPHRETQPQGSTYPVRHRGEQRLRCDYCFRPDHTAEVCYSRAADERQEQRQERMFMRVLTEGLARHQPPHPQQPFHAPLQPSWQPQPEHYPSWNTSSWQGRH